MTKRRIRIHHLCEFPGTDEGKLVLSFKRKNGRGYARCFGIMCGPDRETLYISKWTPYSLRAEDHETFKFLGYL